MPSRQSPQVRHGQIGNLRDVGVGVGAGLEIDLDQAHAGQRTRFHVIDAAGQGEEALERVGDIRFDLLRGHAAVERGHQHDGNIDRRKHVHRHLHDAGDAQHADEETKHDDQVGMSDGKGWHKRSYSAEGGTTSFGATSCAGPVLSLRAEHDHFVFLQSRQDFHFRGHLQAQRDVAFLEHVLAVYDQHAALALAAWLRRLEWEP